jgi:hypothetical protein
MPGYIWVTVGSAVRDTARFRISGLVASRYGQRFRSAHSS